MSAIVLTGKLEFLELADLLQLVGNNGATGVLRIRSHYTSSVATVYIEKGNPVNASQGSLSGLDALLSLFGWLEGSFEFSTADVPVKKAIKKNRMEIILEGLRMVDDGKIDKIGPKHSEPSTPNISVDAAGFSILKGPLVDYLLIADEETFHDGELIVEEGKHGSWMWVVLEGVVEIVKDTPDGPICLGFVSEGGFVGDIATFLAKEHVRGASAIARGSVQLGIIDSQRLSNEFSSLSRKFRDLLLSFDRRLKHVSGNTLRVRLNQPLLAELQQDLSPFVFDENDNDMIYIIRKGRAVVSRPMGEGNVQVILSELSPSDFLGRIPFLNTGLEPYDASVFTSKDIELERLDPKLFQEEYDRLSQTFKNIIEHISASISVTIQTAEKLSKKGFQKA